MFKQRRRNTVKQHHREEKKNPAIFRKKETWLNNTQWDRWKAINKDREKLGKLLSTSEVP